MAASAAMSAMSVPMSADVLTTVPNPTPILPWLAGPAAPPAPGLEAEAAPR
jgi:hypothetical protein